MANFNGIYTARSGIFASQRALDVTAHNIANATSEGYSRQRVVLKTNFAFQQPSLNFALSAGMLGTGVKVETIERMRDGYLDRQATLNCGECEYWEKHTALLQRAELAFAEPNECSLDEALNNFYNVWQDLNQNPTDPGARAAVRETARTLADRFELSNQQLSWAVEEAGERLFKKDSGLASCANRLLTDIAYYNNEIAKLTNSGGVPNDIMDRRDLFVDELSGIAGLIFETNEDGSTDILMKIDSLDKDGESVDPTKDAEVVQRSDGFYLYMVKGATAKTMDYSRENYDVAVDEGLSDTANFLSVGDYKLSLKTGAIAGTMDADIKIRGYIDDLDKMAYHFVNTVNEQHQQGYTLISDETVEGAYLQGGDFFSSWETVNSEYVLDADIGSVDGEGNIVYKGAASLVSIDSAIDKNLSNIAVSGDPFNPEDGANALYVAQLEEKVIPNLNNSTISGFYSGVVTGVGVDLFGSQEKLNVKVGAQEQIELLRQSVSGVNIDEEMTNMIMYHRAYQASSRVIVTVDRMLEELINLIR